MQERRNKLIIQPEYQRGFVWKEPKCSRLIETILCNYPMPEVWLRERHSGKHEVIDGQQRLTTIKAFKEGTLNAEPFKLQVSVLCRTKFANTLCLNIVLPPCTAPVPFAACAKCHVLLRSSTAYDPCCMKCSLCSFVDFRLLSLLHALAGRLSYANQKIIT